MYIIVVGGGKVGYYLSKTLVNEGHEVLVIEKDSKKVNRLLDELGSIAVQGDGAEASVLEDAGTSRADVIVAVTGDDEDNLVICQVAKKKFNVGRTIARINNPKNEHIFKLLGIDSTVSSTKLILIKIEQQIPKHALIHHLTLKNTELEIVETVINEDSAIVGKTLKDVVLPQNCIISLIVRKGNVIIPTGATVFEPADEIVALTNLDNVEALRTVLLA